MERGEEGTGNKKLVMLSLTRGQSTLGPTRADPFSTKKIVFAPQKTNSIKFNISLQFGPTALIISSQASKVYAKEAVEPS